MLPIRLTRLFSIHVFYYCRRVPLLILSNMPFHIRLRRRARLRRRSSSRT